MMSDNDHSLMIGDEGAQTATHPDGDRDGCDFDAYLARDWATNTTPGQWLFTWHPGGAEQPEGYWNGSLVG